MGGVEGIDRFLCFDETAPVAPLTDLQIPHGRLRHGQQGVEGVDGGHDMLAVRSVVREVIPLVLVKEDADRLVVGATKHDFPVIKVQRPRPQRRAHTFLLVAILASLLTGCVANQVTFDRSAFSLAYADMKATAAVRIYQVRMACKHGGLEKAVCADFEVTIKDLLRVETEIRRAIMNPEQQVDWQKVLDYTGAILEMAAKVVL